MEAAGCHRDRAQEKYGKGKPSQVSEEWGLEITRKTNIRTFTLQVGQGNDARELIRQQGKRKMPERGWKPGAPQMWNNTNSTNKMRRTNFSIEVQQDSTRSTEVTALPPSFDWNEN
jgi:hypothetical protein